MPSRRNRRFSAESPCRKPAKTSENTKQDFPLFSFLAIMTLGCVHVSCPVLIGEWNPPENVIQTAGKTFQPDKREARAKACRKSSLRSKHIRENFLVIVACFSRFL